MTIRIEIMDAIITGLKNVFVADQQIYNTRLYKVADANLPAVFVTILTDIVAYELSSFKGGLFKQMREIEVEFVVKAIGSDGASVATLLDGVTSHIESFIYENKTLGLDLRAFKFQNTEYLYSDDSGKPRGTATMLATIQYQIQEPESAIIV